MTTASVIRQIESLFAGGSVAGMTEGELIGSLNAGRVAKGEAAIAALLSRHGPMVLNICVQILGDHDDAEDAFQTVFLVLACKARSPGDPDLMANWLCGVALRTARTERLQIRLLRKNDWAAMMKHSRGRRVLGSPSCPESP